MEKGRKIEMSTTVNTNQETQLGRSISSQNFLERLAERIGVNARASTVFADPVERDGVTVIPVAKARWGIGGGAGSSKNPDQSQNDEGSGGGAGVLLSPVGYIEIKDGRARFTPIYDTGTILQLLFGAGIVAMLVLRGVRKLVRSR